MNYFINDLTKKSSLHILNTEYFLYARKSTDVEDKQVLSTEEQIAKLEKGSGCWLKPM